MKSKTYAKTRADLTEFLGRQQVINQPSMGEAKRIHRQRFNEVLEWEFVRVSSEVDLMAAAARVASSVTPDAGPGSFGVAIQHIDNSAVEAIRREG
jgi:hypothetical protein